MESIGEAARKRGRICLLIEGRLRCGDYSLGVAVCECLESSSSKAGELKRGLRKDHLRVGLLIKRGVLDYLVYVECRRSKTIGDIRGRK